MNIKIAAVSHRLGSRVLEAGELETLFGREPGTVQSLSGVSKLHRITEGEDLVTLSRDASLDALAKAGIPLNSVTGVYSSCNPTTDYLIPSLAPGTE